MNIDITESLLESWLHINKKCHVIQNHWTISTTWNEINSDVILKRKQEIVKMINDNIDIKRLIPEHYLDENKNLDVKKIDTIFKQVECDLIGISYGLDENNYYIMETAFHEKGLHYTKDGKKDNERVYKKLLKEGLIFYVYLAPYIEKNKVNNLYIDFSSPLANDLENYKNDIKYQIVEQFLINIYKKDINSNVRPIITVTVNEEFRKKYYEPLKDTIKTNNVNSELFMRSLKLIDVSDSEYNIDNKKNN